MTTPPDPLPQAAIGAGLKAANAGAVKRNQRRNRLRGTRRHTYGPEDWSR